MTVSRTLQVPNIGPVVFVNSERAKHLSITIKADRTVRLTIPKRVPVGKAREFLRSKTGWIERHMLKLDKLAKERREIQLPKIDRLKAGAALIQRLQELASLHNFKYRKVSIRNQKTRWGSCSGRDNISLNINLARLPAELSDYVIMHELLHTKIKNHGKKFWAELDRLLGRSAKELAKKLRKHRLEVLHSAGRHPLA